MSTDYEKALVARTETMRFETELVRQLIRSLTPGERMAKKNAAPTPEQDPPKPELKRAVFHTSPPSAGDPPEHFALCELHRYLETRTAELNGDAPPTYAPMPKRTKSK